MSEERDYVLGTHDEELERLGLQHRVWRAHAIEAWQSAGFGLGQRLLDVGCGPGYASTDLAEMVGAEGKVVGVDQSQRFLEALKARAELMGLRNIETYEQNLDAANLPVTGMDGAWVRWVFAFMTDARRLLDAIHASLKPGGVLVLHEYFDYAGWRLSPRSEPFEEFVRAVIDAWWASGGEPDIALDILGWLPDAGFEIVSTRPIVHCLRPSDYFWQWPKAFVQSGVKRLQDLGHLTEEQAAQALEAFARADKDPHAHLVTPGVLEVIARKR